MSDLDDSSAPPASSGVPVSSPPFSSSASLGSGATSNEWLSSLRPTRSRHGSALSWIAFASLLVLASALALWWVSSGKGDVIPRTVTPAPEPTLEAVPAPAAPMLESAPAAAAPTLDDSDARVRHWAAQISNSPDWLKWMSGSDLLRRLVGALWTVSQGDSPRIFVPFLSPRASFVVVERGGRTWASAESFARYDWIARVVQGLDAEKAADAWRALEPFIARAHQEIAPVGRTLHETLDQATLQLLRVPVIEGDLQLVEKGAIYVYADPAMERLTAAQKHLLRLGPANARAVQEKIRELREALGLSAVP